jgi:hypothetical protein
MNATIPERYSKHGWHYKLVTRTKTGAIYSQSRNPDLPKDGEAAAYELVHVRFRKARQFERAGVLVAVNAGEYLPRDAEWGQQGWTFPTLARATLRLKRDFSDPSCELPET